MLRSAVHHHHPPPAIFQIANFFFYTVFLSSPPSRNSVLPFGAQVELIVLALWVFSAPVLLNGQTQLVPN